MRKFLLVCFLLLLTVPAAYAQDMMPAHANADAPVVVYSDVWARATVAGVNMAKQAMGGVSAAYMTITNLSDADVTLTGVAGLVASMIEIHNVVMDGDVMMMQPLADGLVIPAGESVALAPGGYHIMLMDLQMGLVPGDAFPLALTYALADGSTMEDRIAVPVLEEAPEAAPFAVAGVWSRPTIAADDDANTVEPGGVSAVYMHLLNVGEADDVLVGVETSVATVSEIHEVRMQNDVMQMQPLADGLMLPPGEGVILAPGGYHIMLMDLTQPLRDGSAFAVTLTLESGASFTVGVPIYDRTMSMAGM
ncbi:MAG: copper chaperone PCu(A)C [Pleurocapsa minor GSE-CHR-MK-17-07R]|nr:copper chaperone PCu(A)C [Pleurocapsa minor GSE-CHR-MK 17-07R]